MRLQLRKALVGLGALAALSGCSTLHARQVAAPDLLSRIAPVAAGGEARAIEGQTSGKTWRLMASADGKEASLRFAPAAGETWDLSRFERVTIAIRNTGSSPRTIRAKLTNGGAKELAGVCQNATTLLPGQNDTLDLRIMRTPADPGFEPFAPFLKYYNAVSVRENTIDASMVDALTIWIDGAKEGDSLEVAEILLQGTAAPGPVPFFPFVDKYGQYAHADWPGKIHDDADFAVRRVEEEKERADWPGPKEWDKFGGWASGPQLEATGNFRVTKHEGKWWLVDPEGKLFFSYGPTGAGFGPDLTPITDRESWFAELPPHDGPTGKFYADGGGVIYKYYAQKKWVGYQFSRANVERKYGPDAADELHRVTAERLRSWGFNTLGNWSPVDQMAYGKTPYVTAIHYGAPKVNDHMPDVFAPEWETNLKARLERERDTTAKDPLNIGYFVDNERKWGKYARFAGVSLQVLEASPTTVSKIEFLKDLKAKYDTIEKLNESWSTQHASWDALLESREKVNFETPANPNLQTDCEAFGEKFATKYFSTCRDLVKAVAPKHLYLGARLNGHIDPSCIQLQTKYCDVISYNMYDASPAPRMSKYADIDFPFMITEWGIDNDPRQSPFRAEKVEVAIGRKGDRVDLLAKFAEDAIVHPQLVGAHFFQYRDQPLTGRPDGEALLRGFVNATDTPNFELVQANRKIAYDLYRKRAAAK
jgi:hypothetical protein